VSTGKSVVKGLADAAVIKGLDKLGVDVVLGERVTQWPDDPEKLNGQTKSIVTDKGSVFESDIVVSN